jgi:L-lactate dehydrogenase complex protein LldG
MNADHQTTGAHEPADPAVRQLLESLAARAAAHPRPAADRPAELEPIVRQVGADADLVARFMTEATGVGAVAYDERGRDGAARVAALLTEAGARRVLLDPTALPERLGGVDVMAALRAAGVEVVTTWDDDTLFAVDAGITGVAAAVAETGSLACLSGPDSARGASLVPPVHIALVRVSQIVPDLFDWYAGLEALPELAANVNLITGPSKTADIEGVLVRGMHGPGQVHIILID